MEAWRMHYRNDAAGFAEHVLGLTLDGKEQEVLRGDPRRVILNCCRQWGKSTAAAAKAVHRMFYEPGSLVVVVGPAEKQSGETIRKMETMLAGLGETIVGDGLNDVSLVIANGSRAVALPDKDKTSRGGSGVNLLIFEEASRVSDEMYIGSRPMVARSGGDVWLISTPNGKQGFFWGVWDQGGERWRRVMATAGECPRLSKEFLEEERRTMSDAMFRQEYMCEFIDREGALFRDEDLAAAYSEEVPGLLV